MYLAKHAGSLVKKADAATNKVASVSSVRFTQDNKNAEMDQSAKALELFYAHLKANALRDDEAQFTDKPLADESGLADGQLIRPRYFIAVRSGFEWNKYNQTHYDADNPPPKVVQGYKFTLFYP